MKTHLRNLLLISAAILLPTIAKAQTNDPAATKSDTCIIILPGGSYCWLARKTEGTEVSEYLHAQGYDTHVHHYPVQGIPSYVTHYGLLIRRHKHPDPIRSLQSLIATLRPQYKCLGVIGFSAGGHLALMAQDVDFIAAIYPVVTMRPPYCHRRSRRALLGEWGKYSQQMRDSLSLELHADRIAAPVFLLNCEDDPVVKWQNSALLDSALTAHHKPHLYTRYRTGGHGFGVNPSKGTPESRPWPQLFLRWLRALPGK